MGLIQTAIGQALGAVGGAALVGKKLNEEDERQAAKEEAAKAAEEKRKSQTAARLVLVAQDQKIASPKQLYFSKGSEEPLGTSNEMASVLATHSLENASNSKKRSRDKVRARKQMLMKRKLVAK